MASKYQLTWIPLALNFIYGFWAIEACGSMYDRHEQWMAEYGKMYKDPYKKEMRYKIFKENVERIEALNNAANKAYKLGINQFADLTNEKFKASRNRFKGHMCFTIKRTPTFK